jgi:hypothetical protein
MLEIITLFFIFQARQDFWRRHQRHLSGGGHAGGAREPLHRAAQGLREGIQEQHQEG